MRSVRACGVNFQLASAMVYSAKYDYIWMSSCANEQALECSLNSIVEGGVAPINSVTDTVDKYLT